MNDRPEKEILDQERIEVLEQIEEGLEFPIVVLGFVWLVLLVVDLVHGLNPILSIGLDVIWVVFILDFLLRLILAPRKLAYIRKNWLTALSLFLPALRVIRVASFIRLLRLARATREMRLIKVVGSLNRGMRALRASMQRRGFSYAFVLTIIVTLVGSAGMLAFEGHRQGGDFSTYGQALWWTAMIMTTLGSAAWPVTPEGRILAFLLSLYAIGVFGYITATLATYFIGRDAESEEAEIVGMDTVEKLRAEIQGLRAEIQDLSGQLASAGEQ